MLNRWTGILCALLMLTANTTLIVRDFLPAWLAGDPPEADDLSHGATLRGGMPTRYIQTGIFDAHGHNVGRGWTISSTQSDLLNITSVTALYPIVLPNGVSTPRVRIDTQLRFRLDDRLLSDMNMSVRGLPEGITLRGELITPEEFACQWRVGPRVQGRFVLDAQASRAIGDILRPFGRLPGLYVGRTWRLQLLDPLSRLLPGLPSSDLLAESELVRVTRTDKIEHRGHELEVFVVEAGRMRGWVTPQGDVVRQEVDLPLLGKLTLRDEPYDEDALQAAKSWSPGGPDEAADDGGND